MVGYRAIVMFSFFGTFASYFGAVGCRVHCTLARIRRIDKSRVRNMRSLLHQGRGCGTCLRSTEVAASMVYLGRVGGGIVAGRWRLLLLYNGEYFKELTLLRSSFKLNTGRCCILPSVLRSRSIPLLTRLYIFLINSSN